MKTFTFDSNVAVNAHGNNNIRKIVRWHNKEVKIADESLHYYFLEGPDNALWVHKNYIDPLLKDPSNKSTIIQQGDRCVINREYMDSVIEKTKCPLCGVYIGNEFKEADEEHLKADVIRRTKTGVRIIFFEHKSLGLCDHMLKKVSIVYRE